MEHFYKVRLKKQEVIANLAIFRGVTMGGGSVAGEKVAGIDAV